ncbi:FAS1-like dehydratase domain-containing protein [Desulfosporosinus youngiae]|uniref:FAS1-like dehydratase domain-containing protein n=1 Tax=Desulfosporosinus youngiae DSM 17734 TaxID=768710 RepID=H5XSW8_9FIRM|nr:MaoC family dehydratase N-terminal domain-containing protein [Desulfosporosinus youngiae]EHQ87931.1 hypothetical protein DesyoDRAFT_0755 [Desulfosporosinus youngiae DSM 17734]
MIGKELIGLETEPVQWQIQPELGRRFAEAIGVPFSDQLPPTLVCTLKQAGFPGIQLPLPGMIHGEQKITYHRQLRIGETLTYQRRIDDVYDRVGKLGKMRFVVLGTKGYDKTGELVFSTRTTLIAPAKGETE